MGELNTQKQKFIKLLVQKYSNLDQAFLEQSISDNLISPFKIDLPMSALEQIRQQIQSLYNLRKWSEQNLADQFKQYNLPQALSKSVCTSYDFHLTQEQELKLIEINTNAAFLALGTNLYESWQIQNNTGFNDQKLIEMFENESRLCQKPAQSPWLIMDEKPQDQRLFVEFKLYQSIFEQNKISAQITDIDNTDAFNTTPMIYNRYTDFYLQDPKSQLIKDLYQRGQIHLSPSPWEYFLIADKQRMLDWQKQNEFSIPSSLLKIYDLALTPKDEIWPIRKNLFFKPKASYGSKQVYKGASMSRKIFEEAFAQGFIAQELAPPAEVEFNFNNEVCKYKYDLRCYAYEDQLQLVIARLYQGQTTNLQAAGGGFTIVDFN